jgi:predicted transcriptional regulator
MASKKNIEITIKESKGAFSIFRQQDGSSKKDYDFSGTLVLRQLLSNEKARILHVIKTKKPKSIYDLAKILNRGFKSVNDDIKFLQRFGFIDLVEEKTKNRKRYKPVIAIEEITFHFKI